MKKTFSFSKSLFSLLVILSFVSVDAIASDAFIDRDGRTFDVTIDGVLTKRIPDLEIKDKSSVAPYTVQWSGKVEKGPHCFRITPKDARLGEPERVDVLIHEVQPDKPYNSWKNYSAVPSTLENAKTFLSGNGFCVSEYTLTDRLRFSSLPAGQYVAMISFWGKGNWDRQTILLTVEKSSEKVNEPFASEAAAAPEAALVAAPAECTITYAATRMMALHQQLEDKVATGELKSDVFSSFGKDTADFGDLYTSNLPEACKRLEMIKNKHHLK